jgi:DNA-binding GntR family transcriptional regulator
MEPKKLTRIDREHHRLSDTVFNTLRRAILDGKFSPGQWLRQEALAEELDVSQITVREALSMLVGEGFCIRVPYKGVRVIEPSPEDLMDIYAMRRLLEGLASELAADRITSEELAQMRTLLPETIVNADPASVVGARGANREFHEIVINACGRRYLQKILKQIWDWIDPMRLYERTLNAENGVEIRERWGESDRIHHTRLIELLEAGDGKQVRQLVADYVNEALENQLTLIDSPADKGRDATGPSNSME